jgi:hypothetical protein
MPAPKKYPNEMRARSIRLVLDLLSTILENPAMRAR